MLCLCNVEQKADDAFDICPHEALSHTSFLDNLRSIATTRSDQKNRRPQSKGFEQFTGYYSLIRLRILSKNGGNYHSDICTSDCGESFRPGYVPMHHNLLLNSKFTCLVSDVFLIRAVIMKIPLPPMSLRATLNAFKRSHHRCDYPLRRIKSPGVDDGKMVEGMRLNSCQIFRIVTVCDHVQLEPYIKAAIKGFCPRGWDTRSRRTAREKLFLFPY